MSKLFEEFLNLFSYPPTACQEEGIEKMISFLTKKIANGVFVLTGYAGTGKTTFISILVQFLKNHQKNFVLLAPTGRAAKVMASYTKEKAFTIHKRIYTLKTLEEGFFTLNLQPNFHKNTLFIVDEASMISQSNTGTFKSSNDLLSDLISYVNSGKNCRLVLCGDPAQLPPVGETLSPALIPDILSKHYGLSVFSTQFKTVVRQHLSSGILANATALRLAINTNKTQAPFFKLTGFNDIENVPGNDLKDVLDSAYSQNDLEDVIILCRSNKRANLYNKQIRNMILFRENIIAAGDIMMVVKNNYFWLPTEHSAGFIANGDTIEILRITNFYSLYGFEYADVSIRLIDYPEDITFEATLLLNAIEAEGASIGTDESRRLYTEVQKDYEEISTKKEKMEKLRNNPHLNALQVKFAYAITTHKAQGGQWHSVFIDYGYLKDDQIDTSFLRWLYTALTRATEKVYLINFDEFFFKKNN